MRTVITCLAWLSTAGVSLGQATPYLATVTADNVTLRSGPGPNLEETGSLAKGELVIVLNEEGEQWLAIEPPRGQVSWVRTSTLEEIDGGDKRGTPRNAIVTGEQSVEIAMGRSGLASPLNVKRDKIPGGTIVHVIGVAYQDTSAGGRIGWTPITPAKGERRFLPRSAVQFTKAYAPESFAVQTPLVRTPAAGEPESTPAASTARLTPTGALAPANTTARAKPEGWPSEPLWRQAEEASDRQEYQRAERLYLQLASDMNRPGGDIELANLCYSRVHAVLEKQRSAGRPAPREARGEAKGTTAGSVRGDRAGTDRPASRSAEPQWTAPGTIRETGFNRDGLAKYSFRSKATGKVVNYLEAGSGVDLGRWSEGEVVLYGTARTTADDVPLFTVTRVDRAGNRRD